MPGDECGWDQEQASEPCQSSRGAQSHASGPRDASRVSEGWRLHHLFISHAHSRRQWALGATGLIFEE